MNEDAVMGLDAIAALTSLSLASREGEYRIIEHNTGIDVDNGARSYDHDSDTDYSHVMWCVLNYMSESHKEGQWTIDDYYTADVEIGRFGCTDRRPLWFHINDYLVDGESRGIHYEFLYRRETRVEGYAVSEGDIVKLHRTGSDEGEWATVVATRWHGCDSIILTLDSGVERVISDDLPYTVKRFL